MQPIQGNAMDLAQYVKQKDMENQKVRMMPIVNVFLPACQTQEQSKIQMELVEQARQEIGDLMIKYKAWKIDAILGLVIVE